MIKNSGPGHRRPTCCLQPHQEPAFTAPCQARLITSAHFRKERIRMPYALRPATSFKCRQRLARSRHPLRMRGACAAAVANRIGIGRIPGPVPASESVGRAGRLNSPGQQSTKQNRGASTPEKSPVSIFIPRNSI